MCSTQITPFLSREALLVINSLNALTLSSALLISCLQPGSSAGLPEYLTSSPASVLMVTTLTKLCFALLA